MFSFAAMRSLVQIWAAENHIGRVRSSSSKFIGMVLLRDNYKTKLHHAGMASSRKIIKLEATDKETQEKVLVREAEVEQSVSAYIFTGPGSQEPGMGMGLYYSWSATTEVWERAGRHIMHNYGFKITNTVRNNSDQFTVRFDGPHGKTIRQNYIKGGSNVCTGSTSRICWERESQRE